MQDVGRREAGDEAREAVTVEQVDRGQDRAFGRGLGDVEVEPRQCVARRLGLGQSPQRVTADEAADAGDQDTWQRPLPLLDATDVASRSDGLSDKSGLQTSFAHRRRPQANSEL
ncbi:hypothetical protein EKPJFOCH_1203 [Methylobacterium thuringiense]|uniref:Uncharacterized protein n=1 Tax=Methylobacterium thuringiense TaxID=1003091 RepID=A0ABQ4TJL4_9HYPH|nr:hypothetical protein EKPJFOCH_1203 [Methylobacterium thuringiense]